MKKTNPLTKSIDDFFTRKNSSDEKALAEIYDKRVYLKPKLGFTIDSQDLWADLGVNIGSFSIFCSGVCAHVYGYEAEKTNFEIAVRNMELNKRYNLSLKNLAVVPDSFEKEFVTLYVNNDLKQAWRHTVFQTNWQSKPSLVKTIKFSDAIKNVDCIKMDIEGAEIPILIEKPNLKHIKKLVFEWSFDRDNKIVTAKKCLDWLKTEFPNVRHPKLPTLSDTWDNFPFCMNVFCWKN